jgi:hypothetical protein
METRTARPSKNSRARFGEAGFDVAAIANAGGWQSLMMPNYYTRELRARRWRSGLGEGGNRVFCVVYHADMAVHNVHCVR